MARRRIHQARAATSSRHSFSSSQRKGLLGEGKKDLFESGVGVTGFRGQLFGGAFAADAAVAEEDESIAEFFGFGDLVDGEKQSAA